MNDRIIKTHQFTHPIDEIWKAISLADEISAWFIKAEFQPEVGYQYTFTHEQTIITGEVLKANPVYELVYTWIVSGTDVETTVSWKLEENPQGTLLTLEHYGISKYPGETAIFMFENFKGGWNTCVTNLNKYLSEK
ncbi:SRPBCC domain-containing protein [uncultured Imperialibacter sp.]|uniref:SRPBCC family protein n=1 Tax=uncultured Imperialibacter sp. TaxID=1672639 RepID=UPI0030DD6A77|tara:strand:- start:736 stop:1143 length:408 start_codon:yes stop_codon:yes gene_type:complete